MTRIRVVLSMVHLVLVLCRKNLVQKMREKTSDQNERWPDHHDAHGREDAKYQWRYQFDGGFGGSLFRKLTALRPQSVRKSSQRLSDGCTKAIGLNQHCDERSSALESGSRGK